MYVCIEKKCIKMGVRASSLLQNKTGAYLNTSNDNLGEVSPRRRVGVVVLNSIEVAVLCLLQKRTNQKDARSSKNDKKKMSWPGKYTQVSALQN